MKKSLPHIVCAVLLVCEGCYFPQQEFAFGWFYLLHCNRKDPLLILNYYITQPGEAKPQ
jgi:hypothetical protein